MEGFEPCPDCRALVPTISGPTHRYLGASPGCWAIFNEIGARSLMDPAYRASHQLVVDTYAAQHPGKPTPQAIQSVCVHLISVHAQLARGAASAKTHRVLARALERGGFRWLEPPSFEGTLNLLHVREPANAAEYATGVREWAQSVWDAWSAHHATIVAWYEERAADEVR